MKIEFFVGEFSEGGAERVISILANELINRGHEVAILKYFNSINYYKTDERIKIYSLEKKNGTRSKIKNIVFLHKHLKDFDGVFVSFLAPFNILALIANIGNKTPLIVADRNDPARLPGNKYLRMLRDYLYCFADKVVVQTMKNKAYFSKKVQKKTEVIYNPLILSGKEGKALNTKKNKEIINIGRLEPQKNQDMLIDVFSKFHQSHPEYKLVIYGEGSYRKELENKINELNLIDYVSLPGNVKDIFDRLCECEFFVLSSNYEGMPNALIEAMGLGVPVVSTRVSGATDLIEDGVNGLLIDLNDKEELLKTMEKLALDEKMRKSIAEESSKIVDLLNSDRICDRWEKIIKDVLH